MSEKRQLVALLTNNDDDVYCFRKELIEAIIEDGYEMLISCPYGEKFELMQEISYIYDNPEIDRRGTNIKNDLKLLIHYYNLFRKYRPAVILTYTAKPNVYGSLAAKVLSIPVINNVTGFGSVLNETGLKQKFIMALFKLAYRQSSCIMFQNSTNMELAKKLGMVKGECRLIPGSGVDTERYPLQPYPDGGNGIEGDTVVFNYIGRVLKDKRIDDYIEAAKIIKEKYPKTEFNILGFIEPTESHYEDELKELEKQGIIKYKGSQKDVKPFIARAHAIIHPSTYGEGMSNVLLENASSGRFIITTDNPGCKETVIDGVTGYIYEGRNINNLVEKIELFMRLSNSDRHSCGIKGREYVDKKFSRKIVVDEYTSQIGRIINDKKNTWKC